MASRSSASPSKEIKAEEAIAEADAASNESGDNAEPKQHSHHSHHRKHKKRSKFRKFCQKHDKLLKILAVVLAFVVLMSVVLFVEWKLDESNEAYQSEISAYRYGDDYAYIGTPVISKPIALVDNKVVEYVQADVDVSIHDITKNYSGEQLDLGRAVELGFDVLRLPTGMSVTTSTLELSETADFSKSEFYDIDKNYTVKIYNLKTNTKYFYKALFTLSDASLLVSGGSFQTMVSPRIMNIGGIRNVRDIGGWSTSDNKSIKQGLLYRGTELDGAVEPTYKLTDEGFEIMVKQLGIRTDMDLRNESDSVSGTYILGNSVSHKYYGCGAYGTVILTNTQPIKEIFSDLANRNAYPIYLHCTYGTDRTGTVCYILGAFLGMSEDDLIKDYELSGIMMSSLKRSNIMSVYYNLQKFEGTTLAEKTANYLLHIGVTQAELDSIKSIFLGV